MGSASLVPVGEFGPFDLISDGAHALYLAGACDEAVQLCYQGLALVEATDDQMTQRYLRYIAGISLNEAGRNGEAVAEAGRLLPPWTRRPNPAGGPRASRSWRRRASRWGR